jgi:hypothetical protein
MSPPHPNRSNTPPGGPTPAPTGAEHTADLVHASVTELTALVRRAVSELARRPDSAVFAELLSLQEVLGRALGDSARTLAEHGSWARVADVAGTTRQAAWHRWRA